MKEDTRFLFAFSASPHKTKQASSTPDRRAKTRRGDFYLRGAAREAGRLLTCKKPPRKKRQGQGTRGSLLFIWCWPGTAEGLPQGPRPRGARPGPAGRGEAAGRGKRCAEPLTLSCPCAHARGRCVFKQRKLHNQSPSVSVVCIPSAPLRWLSGAAGRPRPRALSPARPRLSPLPGALTPFHYCTARCDRDSSATGKEGQPGRWSQRWHSSCGGCRAGGRGRARVGWKDPGFVPELAPPIGMMLGDSSRGRGSSTGGSRSRTTGRQRARPRSMAPDPAPRRAGEASPAAPGRRAAAAPRQLRRALIRPSVPSHHPFPWAPEVPKGTAGTT